MGKRVITKEAPLRCAVKIGKVSLTFWCPSRRWHAFITTRYKPYLTLSPATPDTEIFIAADKIPCPPELLVSKNGRTWEISRTDFHSVSDIRLRETRLTMPLNRYSFDSWLRVFFTLRGLNDSALLIHGAGYFLDGRSYLFPGRSGSGKSTLISILGKERALSDEIVLVGRERERPEGNSTPFWGELRKGTGDTYHGKLNGMFFLRHGAKPAVVRITPGEALRRLLPTVLFFTDEKRLLERVLRLATYIVRKVPAYTLTFSRKDSRTDVLDVLQSIRGRNGRNP